MDINSYGITTNINSNNINSVTSVSTYSNVNISNFNMQTTVYSFPDPYSSSSKNEDQVWIDTWLSKIGKTTLNLPTTELSTSKIKIPINVAKSSLRSCLLVIEKLQIMQEDLKNNAETMSSVEWKKKTSEIGILKDQFSKFISQFENPDAISQLKNRVCKRRKKRMNQKLKKMAEKDTKLKEMEERQQLHKKIDEWLESKKDEVERIKSDENMKKDADCVLAEVTKKKSDARKQLNLISALVKLRSVREQVAVQQNRNLSTEDAQAFAKITEQLTKTWEDSLNQYSKEEQGLRCMLEQNAVEDTIAARVSTEKRIVQEWETALFGPKVIPTPIYWGLTCAEKNLETFIAIRKSWDTFLTNPNNPEGSKIPVGWVLPNQDPLQTWKNYLESSL